jgi:hypothetical protein
MTPALSTGHRKRFEEIKRSLSVLGSREYNFIQVELLFFEALSISRQYGEDPQDNTLLASLRQVQHTDYEKTKLPTRKKNQRETVIRRFISSLRKVLH